MNYVINNYSILFVIYQFAIFGYANYSYVIYESLFAFFCNL